jgi:hypothetical protein
MAQKPIVPSKKVIKPVATPVINKASDGTRPPPIIGNQSTQTTPTTVKPVAPITTTPSTVKPAAVVTPPIQTGGRPAPIIGKPTSGDEFLTNWSKLSPEEQAKRAPGALEELRQGASQQDKILSGLTQQARAYKQALIKTGSSEEEANLIVSGLGKPNQGFARAIPNIKKGFGALLPDVLDFTDIPLPGTDKNLGEGFSAGVSKLAPLGNKLGVPFRTLLGITKEIGQEIDVWRGTTERGEETFAALPGQFRERVGPFGMFGGAPVGLESMDVPRTSTGKAGFQWSEVLDVINKEGAGAGSTVLQNLTGNLYIDQGIAAVADVFGDPLNIASAGAGGIATKSVAKVAQYGPDAYRAAELTSDALRAQGKLALKREVVKETLEAAAKAGDTVLEGTARTQLKIVEKELTAATKKVAGGAAPRLRGRTGAQALATNLSEQIDNLKTQLRNPNISPEQAANIRLSLEFLTPELVKNVASKGMAGLIDSATSLFKTSGAADVLGVSNRLRIGGYVGRNQKFGKLLEIPGTEAIVQGSGKLISKGLGGTRLAISKALIDNSMFVPDGNGGVFPDGIGPQRAAVRAGTATAEEVGKNLELNKLNETFRGRRVLLTKDALATAFRFGLTDRQAIPAGWLKGNIRKLTKNIAPNAGYTKDDLQSILPFITDSAARAAALPTLSSAQRKALESVRGLYDAFLQQEIDISKLTGREIGIITDYFPQFLSDETLAAVRKNPRLMQSASTNTGYNFLELKGNFLSRSLKDGDDFFGVEITPEILKKGVTELNRIANAGGWKGKFFEDDVLVATQKYINRHVDDMARQLTLSEAADIAPRSFARELVGPTSTPASFDPPRIKTGFRKFIQALARYPELSEKLDLIADVLDIQIDDLDTLYKRGTYDLPTVTALQDAALKDAEIALNLELATAGKKSAFDLSSKRFSSMPEILNRGFITLQDAAPNVYASPEVEQLFTTVDKWANVPADLKRVKNFFGRELTMNKTFQLATPRNIYQNFVGNYSMMIFAARAQLKNLSQGGDIFTAVNKGVRMGKSVDEVAQELVAKGVVKNAKEVVDAYALIGSVGFGRYGEIGAEVGNIRKPGLRQGPAQGLPILRNYDKGVTKYLSQKLGTPVKSIRQAATAVEERQRFQFMWDGLKQGLTPQEAVARVQYYLFDFEDISQFDRFAKQIIPYYMWISRNAPRQLTIKALEPRPYVLAQKFKNATQEEDSLNPDSPNYNPLAAFGLQRGAFVTKDMEGFGKLIDNPWMKTIDPGLPLIGFGEESPSKYFTSPLQAFAGPLRAELRLPFELAMNKIIGLGDAPISKYSDVDPGAAKFEYALRQLGFAAPLALAKRYLQSIPYASRSEVIQKIFDIGPDENQPGEQALGALARVFGFPFQPAPRTKSKIGQISGGIYDAKDVLEERKKKLEQDALREYEKRQQKP